MVTAATSLKALSRGFRIFEALLWESLKQAFIHIYIYIIGSLSGPPISGNFGNASLPDGNK